MRLFIRFITAVICLWLLFPLSFAAAQPFGVMSSQGPQRPQNQVLSSPIARFVFGQVSDSSKDQFMLDTRTGRLWRISERGDIGMFLTIVPYCDSEGKCQNLPEQTPDSAQGEVEKP